MEEIQGGNETALKSEIIRLTTENWAKSKRALLLARVGQDLTRRGYNLKTVLRGQKLAAFVRQKLTGSIDIVTSPHDTLVQGLVPASVAKEQDINSLFERTSENLTTGDRINFDKRLWVSFSHPVRADCVRTIEFEPEIRYQDVALGAANSKLVIPSELIIPLGAKPKEERDAQLQKNILTWFESNKLDIALGKARYREDGISEYDSDSILALFINALDSKDRERVVLPLDIVGKLLHKKIRRH